MPMGESGTELLEGENIWLCGDSTFIVFDGPPLYKKRCNGREEAPGPTGWRPHPAGERGRRYPSVLVIKTNSSQI